MIEDTTWTNWRQHISTARTLPELRRRLLHRAGELGTYLRQAKSEYLAQSQNERMRRLDEWKLLGIEVRTADISSGGAAYINGSQRLVVVRKDDPPLRQRFTVAHELGHLLITAPHDQSVNKVSRSQEEALCDEFASNLLIPAQELEKTLSELEHHPDLKDFLWLCKLFSVGLHPMLIALRPHLKGKAPIFIAATYRGHPSRPDVQDFRVDAAAYPQPFYIATHQRLRSIGLSGVAEWATGEDVTEGRGTTDSPRFKLWNRISHKSGTAVGPGEWQATKLSKSNVVLVRIETKAFDFVWAQKSTSPDQ